jgi:hypothetical protein
MRNRDYVVVSEIPRSGTSMLMRLLQAGGLPLLTDDARGPDVHNPYGYFEYERVKTLGLDTTWSEFGSTGLNWATQAKRLNLRKASRYAGFR